MEIVIPLFLAALAALVLPIRVSCRTGSPIRGGKGVMLERATELGCGPNRRSMPAVELLPTFLW